jgi:hypothetical protein
MPGRSTVSRGKSGMRAGLMVCETRARNFLAHRVQRRLHFVAGVHIAGSLRDDDAVRKEFAGLIQASEAREQLRELEVARRVIRLVFEKLLEMFGRGVIVAFLRTLHGQPVARKGVAGLLHDELLQHLSPRLLRLGHGPKARIIAARNDHAKHRA